MPEGPKKVELWNGKKVVGYIFTSTQLLGKGLSFYISPGIFKEVYQKKYETIFLPLDHRIIFNDGVDFTYRAFFNVSKKSKRQIKLLLNAYGTKD